MKGQVTLKYFMHSNARSSTEKILFKVKYNQTFNKLVTVKDILLKH